MTKEFILYCDESEQSGRYFSNFYGGALIKSDHVDLIRREIASKKLELNLGKEVKWNRITKNYESKYISLINKFFDFIECEEIKIRIMFTTNRFEAINLTKRHHDEKYFILYYQFIKHAFGFMNSPPNPDLVRIRVYPDKLPDNEEQRTQFKQILANLSRNTEFRRRNLVIRPEDVAEIDSKEHDILQCLDVILGAMHFRLNDKHKEKPEGAAQRGKRTLAKERVYREIGRRIRSIYPGFNIGITTGTQGDKTNRWHHPYRHWQFKPYDKRIREIGGKK